MGNFDFKTFFDTSLEMLCIANSEGYFIELNPRWSEILGYSIAELKHEPFVNFVHPEDKEKTIIETKKLAVDKYKTINFTNRYLAKNGNYLWIMWNSTAVGDYIYAAAADISHYVEKCSELEQAISELKDHQTRLIESARLVALGEMAGNIAHEINNPLAILKACTANLGVQIEKAGVTGERILKNIQTIDLTIDRVTSIIDALRAYSREDKVFRFCKVSARTIVKDSLLLCREKMLSYGITINESVSDPLDLDCHPAQVRQVMLNLLNNAFYAVKNGKKKEIALSVAPSADGSSVIFSVRDSGPGIAPELSEKIFAPFFTTKPIGEGTGLGLSISLGIARRHRGTLKLTSLKPTEFQLILPLRQA